MRRLPDMRMVMDLLMVLDQGVAYYWTLAGTNCGHGVAGHKVQLSGLDLWQIGSDGLIASSRSQFDAAYYQRQLDGLA